MILTLTINPSVDRNVFVDRLVFEDRAYILSRSDSAGGRGINASRVLHSFSAKSLAVVTAGGANGEKFQKLLAKSGFPVKVVPIKNEIRTNFTITDRQGLAIKLNETGPALSADELVRLEKTVEAIKPPPPVLAGGRENTRLIAVNFNTKFQTVSFSLGYHVSGNLKCLCVVC